MLRFLDTGTIEGEISDYNKVNEKVSMYKYPYILINVFVLFLIQIIGWLISCIIGNCCYDNKVGSIKDKCRKVCYISLPIAIFICTVQELSLTIFYQFQLFYFRRGIRAGLSSYLAIPALIYIIGFTVYLAYMINCKKIHYNREC